MKEQLISFQVAKLAKEKGFALSRFDYPKYCDEGKIHNNNWNIGISAPTQSLLQHWLREKHIIVWCVPSFKSWTCFYSKDDPAIGLTQVNNTVSFGTYKEALEKGLLEALKLI